MKLYRPKSVLNFVLSGINIPQIMKLYRSKSVLNLVVIGFSMASLPLILALIYAVISVDHIVDQNQQSLSRAVGATGGIVRLTEHLTAMKRSAEQRYILKDNAYFDLYEATHKKLLETMNDLRELQVGEPQQGQLLSLMKKEKALFKILQSDFQNNTLDARGAEEIKTLVILSRSILSKNRLLIDQEIKKMQEKSKSTQKSFIWLAMGVISITFFIVLVFTDLITRPIRQIDRSIRKLGDGALSSEISISGPKDLEYLGKRLDWLRTRLMELEQQKSQFLRHVSHELKTPLTAMRAGVELLIDEVSGGLNKEQQKIVAILDQKNIQLQKMIEALLNFSVVLEKHSALSREKVRLKDVIERVVADHNLAIRAREIHLELNLEDQSLLGDEDKLVVVIDNLISNALKFTPQKGEMKIFLNKRDDKVLLDVIDSGPGIYPEEKLRVFDPFYQGKYSTEKNVEGTGIGLSLVKEYVVAHHGIIEILDKEESGGHFRVTLPIQSVPEEM